MAESENKELASRLESLESIVRMLELKHKNSLEHASRLEERESDLKKVNSVLFFLQENDIVNGNGNKTIFCLFKFNRNMQNFMIDILNYSKHMLITWKERNS